MLTRISPFVLLGLSLAATAARADFLPPNNLHLEDGLRSANLTEKDFNEVIDEAQAIYAPIIKNTHKGTLKINRLWTNTTVNASATQIGSSWEVNMYGGLARRPEITRDGFSMVLCHEIGHHLGGYPFSSSWAANEGESDYFATISCARQLWKDSPEANAEFRKTIAASPKAKCDAVWTDETDQDLCYRTMAAGKSTADLLSALGGTKIGWDTPDKKVVKSTDNAHPQGQCRLDTYMAGALCNKEFDEKIIPGKDLGSRRNGKDAEMATAKFTCTKYEDYDVGVRPLCWFKPAL